MGAESKCHENEGTMKPETTNETFPNEVLKYGSSILSSNCYCVLNIIGCPQLCSSPHYIVVSEGSFVTFNSRL